MPNIEDPETRELHTGYFISVNMTYQLNNSWQIIARYAKFYGLYCKLSKALTVHFPNGMLNLFPNDRWKTMIFGVTDSVRNSRQKGLDLWLRELVMNPKLMLDKSARSILFDFLEVDKHKGQFQVSSEYRTVSKEQSKRKEQMLAPSRRATFLNTYNQGNSSSEQVFESK